MGHPLNRGAECLIEGICPQLRQSSHLDLPKAIPDCVMHPKHSPLEF